MARFRLFGRTPAPARASSCPAPSYPAPSYGAPPGWGQLPAGPPPVGAGTPWPGQHAGPATHSARPASSSRAGPAIGGGRCDADDPPTDPYGFPPVPGPPSSDRSPWPAAPPSQATAPDQAEAAALAGAFAVDYLSWDEDDPDRRGRVMLDYLPVPGDDPARLGWSGRGRQRAEFALPGRVRPDGDGRLLVDVRVRVTPYRAVGDRGPVAPAEAEADITGVPAAAPAPTGRGWRSLASCWIRLSVPVVVEGGRLMVDAWEETLGEAPALPPRPGPAAADHALADDDPLVEPRAGGAW